MYHFDEDINRRNKFSYSRNNDNKSSYNPDFIMPNWNVTSKNKIDLKPKRKHRFLKCTAIVASIMILSYSFGYMGSLAAINRKSDINESESIITESNDMKKASVSNGLTNTDNSSMSIAEKVADFAASSIVEITTESIQTGDFFMQQIVSGAGSGIVISSDGYIVTNNHVIEGCSKITVTMKNSKKYSAEIVGIDKKTDIAVIKISASGLQSAVFGKSDNLKVGEPAVVIGNPLGQLGGTVTNGIISALGREITIDNQIMTLLQTNAAINPGNSGGGLFNKNGELVGIVNAKSCGSDVEGLGFAIPVDTAKPVIDDLIDYGFVQGRVDLGMSIIDVDDIQTAMIYRVSNLGVFVLDVAANSNAAKSGIQSGDQIISVDGKKISAVSDINKSLNDHSVGDSIDIVIWRNGRKGKINFILEEYKGKSLSL